MLATKRIFILAGMIVMLGACKQTYISPYQSPALGYLVVEGNVNSAFGQTTIQLSRTTGLADGTKVIEPGATVEIQDQNTRTYSFAESRAGYYSATDLNLDSTITYRLHILTGGKEYFSDYVPVNPNPVIDSIPWVRQANGVQLAVATHDASNRAKYFSWDFSETWEIHSTYAPDVVYSSQTPYYVYYFNPVRYYLRDSSKYQCWKGDSSDVILLGSTLKYAVDTISYPLALIPPADEKLSALYSINVHQYSFSKDGYEFLQKMKKNTEQLGTVFDAQPSDIQGNIHCKTSPAELVIGFFTVCPRRDKRVFISNGQLADWNYAQSCLLYVENNDSATVRQTNFYPDGLTPILLPVDYVIRTSSPPPSGVVISFSASQVECVDCTTRGSGTKPDFWP